LWPLMTLTLRFFEMLSGEKPTRPTPMTLNVLNSRQDRPHH
jgi:hypothetical protein